MKSKDLYKKLFQSILLIMITLFFNVSLSFGQNEMTKLKDGSVAGVTSATAAPYSILELESVTKGFLLPRMTTVERDKIVINDKIRGNGLVIYNVENDCINYWSTTVNKWLSVCGTLPPAKLTLDCSKVYLSSNGEKELKQGQSLRDTDILYLTVNVLETGSYNISAVTNNGYSFSKTGIFETKGIYSIALEGLGTPLEANETLGDLVTFLVNGKKDTTCNSSYIKVKSSQLDFKLIEPQAVDVSWPAYKGVALNANDNKIKVLVDVTTVGFWRIQSTETLNGISFSGSGEFTQTGQSEVYLYAQGVPERIENSTFKFITNSKTNKTPNVTAQVKVVPTSFDLVCDASKIQIRGEYREDSFLNKSNSILIPIKVLAPGVVDIELLGVIKGSTDVPIKFVAPSTILTFNGSDNIQYVTLYPEVVNGKNIEIPVKSKTIEFNNITPNKGGVFCPSFPITTVVQRSKNYTFDCNESFAFSAGPVGKNNVFLLNTPLESGKHGISVNVNVGYAENYTIKTNTVNGVYFTKTGTFSDDEKTRGKATIVLDPIGKFTSAGNVMFNLTAEGLDVSTSPICSIIAKVKSHDIVVLSLGGANYGANSSSLYAGGAILKSPTNFGPNGTVKVNSVTVLTTSAQGNALESFINANKVDIIVNVIGYNFSTATQDVLVSFVRDKKGVLIVGDENTANSYTKNVIERLAGLTVGGSGISASGSFTMLNPVLSSANSESIINGPFGNLAGKLMGNDAHNGWYYSNLPNSYIPLVSKQGDSNSIWALKHRDLGFMFVGDGGWFIGKKDYVNPVIFPSNFDNQGVPKPKSYTDNGTVYNAVLYANALAWAIDYVIIHKK
ncbi:hypothetical protein [Myroides sp. N17-2]|uniref:hypothetical protein n=1 Tax=Myroides sp. N17-2 TaxID=2030799 RepID=UPI000EFBB0CF|nr:hypothetical protein [Myroides sp. N17-2]